MERYKTDLAFLAGGGEMGALTRSRDWSQTPLGEPGTWPQSLRTALSLLLNSKFPMFLWWGPELISFYNDAYRPSLGMQGKHPAILGMPAVEAWPEIWTIIKPLIDQVLSGGEATWSEDQLIPIYRNGKMEDVYWTFSYSPVKDESGKAAGVFVTCSETTGKVYTLKKLEEANKRFITSIEQAPVAMCMLQGPDYVVEIANEMMLRIWGKQAAEVMHKPLFEGLPEVKGQGIESLLKGVFETGNRYIEYERSVDLPRATGIETTYINFAYEAYRDTAGKVTGIIATATEVTQQVMARKKLEESEQRLNVVIEASELGTWEFFPDADFAIYSERALEILGHDPALPVNHTELLKIFDSEARAIRDAAFKLAFETGVLYYEANHRWKDNSEHWMEVKGKVFYDHVNKPLKLVGTIRDVTGERTRQRELQESESKLRQLSNSLEQQVKERTSKLEEQNLMLEKMNKELQSFAYISSHDLQEPLRKIQTFSSQVLEKEYENLSETGKDKFRRMQNAAKRMQMLIDDLLSYSRTAVVEAKFEKINLAPLVAEVQEDLKEELAQKGATIEIQELCDIQIIPFQFRQMMYNLLSNSLKFSRPEVAPHISISCKVGSGGELNYPKLDPAKKYCRLTLTDNGIGFEPRYSDKIFEVFQRLHGRHEYSGTGIGLAIVKKIVENHNGFITASGNPNEGAMFDIFLPVWE